MPPGIPVGIEKEKARANELWLFQFICILLIFTNMSTSKEILDGRTPDADGYIPVKLPDIIIGLPRSVPGQEIGRITRTHDVTLPIQNGRRSAIFLTKKAYQKTILFEDQTPKLIVNLEPLNLTNDKQNKRRNIDGAGVHGEDIRDRTSERDPGMC